jgi:hypothetical protein
MLASASTSASDCGVPASSFMVASLSREAASKLMTSASVAGDGPASIRRLNSPFVGLEDSIGAHATPEKEKVAATTTPRNLDGLPEAMDKEAQDWCMQQATARV